MSKPIDAYLKAIDKAVTAVEGAVLSADQVDAMRTIGDAIESWCDSNNLQLFQMKRVGNLQIQGASESFDTSLMDQVIGPDKILDLVEKAHVAPEHKRAAAKRVACLIAQTCGMTGRDSFNAYKSTDAGDATLTSVESLYAPGVSKYLNTTAALETFGINMDRVEPDLKTILTISLLQFHTNLTPRVVPLQTVTQGNVTIVRESMEVFDLSDTKMVPTRVIELYKDPSMVTVKATRIKPLMGENNKNAEFLVADDIYKFNKNIVMFEMALDESKPGYDKYNHTDLVEDNILFDKILLKVVYKADTSTDAVTFWRMLPISPARGRLTQFTNDVQSTDRRLALDRYPTRILVTDEADTLSGNTSDKDASTGKYKALAPLVSAGNASLGLDLHIGCHVDRRTSNLDATAWLSFEIKGGTFATESDRTALAAKYTITCEGFMLDARYNEDNKRKTSVRAEMKRRSMSYELPSGRNFVVDSAIGQDGVLNAAARLAQLEHIGRDYNNLAIIEETLKAVHDQNVSIEDGKEARASLAVQYAAGDLVNPYVYTDTLDFTNMYGVRSADASGDVKQFVKSYFNRLTSELLQKSFYQEQLAAGAPVVFRVITSNPILGEIFCCKHIHQHLETDSEGTGGVQHVVVLDNGVRLEIVTTTFDSIQNKIILIPFLANSQTSVLNFGTDYDQGTMVGAISVASDGGPAYHRLFSTTRELLVPTCPFGAIISVTGVTSAMGATDTNASITVLGV